jgi:hypothetical protein
VFRKSKNPLALPAQEVRRLRYAAVAYVRRRRVAARDITSQGAKAVRSLSRHHLGRPSFS